MRNYRLARFILVCLCASSSIGDGDTPIGTDAWSAHFLIGLSLSLSLSLFLLLSSFQLYIKTMNGRRNNVTMKNTKLSVIFSSFFSSSQWKVVVIRDDEEKREERWRRDELISLKVQLTLWLSTLQRATDDIVLGITGGEYKRNSFIELEPRERKKWRMEKQRSGWSWFWLWKIL